MHHELRVIVHITPEEFLISQDSSNFLMPRGEFAKHRKRGSKLKVQARLVRGTSNVKVK